MRKRAFTLIEVTIVIAILSICLVPVGMLAIQGYQSFTALSMQNSTKADCQRAAERIFRLAASTGNYQIDSDHHGLTFGDGSKVRWLYDRLELTQQGAVHSLLTASVRDFVAIRQGQILTLNLSVESKQRPHGQPVRLHEIYDYPRVGLP